MLYAIMESNHIQFSFQLMVSELFFLIGRPKRNHFPLRLAAGLSIYLVLADIWEGLFFDLSGEAFLSNILLYLGYALMTAVLICFCYEIRMMELVFTVTGGYATEHMCFALSRILLYVSHVQYTTYGSLFHLLMTRYVIYAAAAAAVYFLLIRKNQDPFRLSGRDGRIVLLSAVLLVTAIVLSVYWSYPGEYTETRMGEIICPAYSFLSSIFVLMMEYYVLRENNMKHEKEVMEQMLLMADAQQKSAKETIDIINIKCHDLKHQIKALAKMEDAGKRSEYLKEVQDAVSIYDAIYHTGNKALDYILREKTLLFKEYQVEFSCMVEGDVTLFMDSADIYSLMGNALDNALEGVLKEAEDERIISLQIKSCGDRDMVLLHLENRCSRELKFRDGLPVTDKEDKHSHGFGVRSIRYITEKYQGELFMRVKNGRFFLDILFPRKNQ